MTPNRGRNRTLLQKMAEKDPGLQDPGHTVPKLGRSQDKFTHPQGNHNTERHAAGNLQRRVSHELL